MARPVREELTPKQLSCISELVMKDITGKTNEQIANELGINLATLYRWRKNKMFNDRLTAEAEELNNGDIQGAGLDVLSIEPPKSSNPLLTAKNCIITPHIAWAAYETRKRLLTILEENLKAFIDGNPQNVVNK